MRICYASTWVMRLWKSGCTEQRYRGSAAAMWQRPRLSQAVRHGFDTVDKYEE